jgi:hypothetical protein
LHPQDGLKIDIVPTVILKFGLISSWLHGSLDGVARKKTEETSIEAIRQSFVSQSASEDNQSEFVCIVRLKDKAPHLLRAQAFDELCVRLADRIECGAIDAVPDSDMPLALQAFIAPNNDMRLITTASFNQCTLLSCHMYQRKFSSQYLPLGLSSASNEVSQTSVFGAVNHILKAQLEASTLQVVKHVSSRHKLAISKIICEHIQDSEGKIYLLSILQINYASTELQELGSISEEASAAVGSNEEVRTDSDALQMKSIIHHDTIPPSPSQSGVNAIPPWMQSPPSNTPPTAKAPRIFSASPKSRSSAALESTRPMSASPFSAAKKALGSVSYLTANGIHANNGSRPTSALNTGAPAMIKRLADEVELLKEKLHAKDKELEGTEERLVQSELGRKKDLMQHEAQCAELRRQKDELRDEIEALKVTAHEAQCRAEIAEGKLDINEKDRQAIRAEYQEEISAALSSLRSSQLTAERNEAEVLRLNELLKAERSQLLSGLQSLSYDNTQSLSSVINDPSLIEVAAKVKSLLESQENPEGETYSLKKALHQYRGDLQELFLYFAQLGSSSVKQWPPVLSYSQWLLFCTQHGLAESKGTLSSPHPRLSSSSSKKLAPKDAETVFLMHSEASLQASDEQGPAITPKSPQHRQHSGHLTYPSFLACFVQLSVKLHPHHFLTDSITQLLSSLVNKKTAARPQSPAKERPTSPTKMRGSAKKKKVITKLKPASDIVADAVVVTVP